MTGTYETYGAQADAQIAADAATLAATQADLDTANAKVADLEAQLAAPPPAPVPSPRVVVVGADPTTSRANLTEIDTKWGAGTAARCYTAPGLDLGVPSGPLAGRVVCVSFSPTLAQLGQPVTAGTKAALAAIAAAKHAYVCANHEIDRGTANGKPPIASQLPWVEQALMPALPAGVDYVQIVTGWGMTQADRQPWTQWQPKGATVFGMDFDGFNPSATAYPDYSPELAVAKQIIAAGTRVIIPEFGCNLAPWDTDGSKLAAWISQWVGAFIGIGVEAIWWWENAGQAGSTITLPAPKAALSALISAHRS